MKRPSWIIIVPVLCIALLAAVWFIKQNVGPQKAESLSNPRIYAYKDWQSIGIQVNLGDRVDIRAEGTWLYTPGEYHGPEGHRFYRAPNTYPINAAAGGILLGRIGEDGPIFIVGKGRTLFVDRSGLLYFRINDDILSDNEGYVSLEVSVTPGEIEE
jgi:hypothetical protein